MRPSILSKNDFWVLFGILLTLVLVRFLGYLPFHVVAELFSIFIGTTLFLIGWNARSYIKNNSLLFLCISSLFISLFDLLHLLAFKGMNLFPFVGANIPTQLWIVARYTQAISLVIVALGVKRNLNRVNVFWGFIFSTTIFCLAIFYFEIFPTCYEEGTGLSPFKIISE